MVLSKLREQLGLDQLEAVYVGAAPTPLPVLEFFHAIGVPVAELWGLSESTGSGAVNLPGQDQARDGRPVHARHGDEARPRTARC